MASKALIIKDKKKNELITKFEFSNVFNKHIRKHPSNLIKYYAILKNYRNPINSTICKMHNRCIVTGRPRAILRKFRLSRQELKRMHNYGLVIGLRKSSW